MVSFRRDDLKNGVRAYITFVEQQKFYHFVRGYLYAKCPLTNPQSAPHTAVCLHCLSYIRSTAGAQRASSPALTTMSCNGCLQQAALSCTRIPMRRASLPGCRMLPIAFHGWKANSVAGEHTAMEGLHSLLAVILSLLITQEHFSLVLSFVARL